MGLLLSTISVGWIVGIVIAVVLVIAIIAIVAWAINTRNKFVIMDEKTNEAFSTMDVYLKKRYDMIPNLVETVKGYMKHENETLTNVIAARSATNVQNLNDKVKAEGELTNALSKLMMLTENYPELKADRQFIDLQTQIKAIEVDISNARKYFNGNVKAFNTSIRVFPSNIVANMMHLEKKEFFEIAEVERENVKISFD